MRIWILLVAAGLAALPWTGVIAHKVQTSRQVQQRDTEPVTLDRGTSVMKGDGARDKPELPYDLITFRHLAMEWGHLAGFGLWLTATTVGLLDPWRRRPFVLISTWAAFAIEGITGLYKMDNSTPFATPLRLFSFQKLPRIYFADDYAMTLAVKHSLMVTAMVVTLALTILAWRSEPNEGIRTWRALLGVNLLLALMIAAAATVLGFYHAIVLHFS